MKSLLAAVAISSLAATMPLLHPSPTAGAAPAYGVNVSIHPEGGAQFNPYQFLAAPSRNAPTAHICQVTITDLGTTQVFKGPKLVLTPGDRQTRSQPSGAYVVAFTASLSRDGRHATWDATLRKDGRVLTQQTSDTWLEPAAK